MKTISLRDNRLFIEKEAAELLEIEAEDRVDIRYWSEGSEIFPVIAKAFVFGDTEGKRVSKKLTVSYRGQQAQVLSIYGTDFEIEEFKDNMFRMRSISLTEDEAALTAAEEDLNNMDEAFKSDNLESFDW